LQLQKPILSQVQKLKMNPQLYQSIQLMALPIQDLKLRIQEEVETNPALELVKDDSTVSIDDIPKQQKDDYDAFENSSDPGYREGYDDEASDSKRKFMEGALSRSESLQDHLLWQLRLQKISEEQFNIGELLIRNLDDNGFHREIPEELVSPNKQSVLKDMIKIIQTFDPVGTCTKNYRESLLVQANLIPEAPDITLPLLTEYFDLLEKGKYQAISKKMKIPEDRVLEALAFIKSLNPFPGSTFSTEKPRYVIPDIMVTIKEGEFVIIMNDEEIPVLRVNPFFESIMGKEKKPQEKNVKKFVNTKIKDARWFINSIHQRNQTLLKVSRTLVEFQREFFLKGPKFLVPLTLKDIAKEIGVHESTVGRISNGKYIQTEWGIYEIKYFFSNSISGAGSSGSRFSKEGVKQVIKEILEAEGSDKHLSDQKLSDLLSKRGINIARRTVAKYRKELDIASSYNR
jgi:RNA polymerase sigma-54 factor